jgi:RNA polymerase Rpb1, domain 1
MTDEDCRALGFNPAYARPDWMVLTVMPVPPPPVRPSVLIDGSNRWDGRIPSLLSTQASGPPPPSRVLSTHLDRFFSIKRVLPCLQCAAEALGEGLLLPVCLSL